MVKTKRPVDLPLLKIRLPIGGVISIIHRITGALLVLILPLATVLLDHSLESQRGFENVSSILESPLVKLLALAGLVVLIQHTISGIRHLLLDLQIGMDRETARRTAWTVPVVTLVITAIFAGMMFT